MKHIIALLILLFPALAIAQAKQPAIQGTCTPNCQTNFILKTSVLSPVLQQPGVRLGVELPFDSFYSIQPMVGYYYAYNKGMRRMDKSQISYDARIDFKYYLPKASLLGLYTGPMFVFSRSYYEEGANAYRTEYNPVTGKDEDVLYINFDNPSHLRQDGYALMWDLGLQPIIAGHFAVDVYIAAGAQLYKNRLVTPADHNKITSETVRTHSADFATMFGLNVGYAF